MVFWWPILDTEYKPGLDKLPLKFNCDLVNQSKISLKIKILAYKNIEKYRLQNSTHFHGLSFNVLNLG